MIDSNIKPNSDNYKVSKLANRLLSHPQRDTPFAFDEILEKLLNHARLQLGMEVAFISEIIDHQFVVRYTDSADGFAPIKVNDSSPIVNSGCFKVIDGRLPEFVNDSRQRADINQMGITHTYQICSYLSLPLVLSDNSIYGSFCLYSRQPSQQLSQRDVDNIRFLAKCVTVMIERGLDSIKGSAQLRHDVERVIEQEQLFTVFQPVFNLETGSVRGFEALSRITAQPRKPPDLWFRQAQQVGLQSELEMFALRTAINACARIPHDTHLAFNLSADTIIGKQQEIISALAQLPKAMIEITEHEVIEDYLAVNDALKSIRAAGIKLAVDDVGAGFASFKHILSLKPDIIKIDQSIVKNIDQSPEAQAITQAIASFAQELGYKIVAEGIETQAELHTLKRLQVKRGQGFLLGVPNKAAQVTWGGQVTSLS